MLAHQRENGVETVVVVAQGFGVRKRNVADHLQMKLDSREASDGVSHTTLLSDALISWPKEGRKADGQRATRC